MKERRKLAGAKSRKMSAPFQDTPPAFEGEEDPAADFLASQQNQLADLEDGDDFGFNSNTDTGE